MHAQHAIALNAAYDDLVFMGCERPELDDIIAAIRAAAVAVRDKPEVLVFPRWHLTVTLEARPARAKLLGIL